MGLIRKEGGGTKVLWSSKASFSHSFRCSKYWVGDKVSPKMSCCPVLDAASQVCALFYDLVHILSHKWNEKRRRLTWPKAVKEEGRHKDEIAKPESSKATFGDSYTTYQKTFLCSLALSPQLTCNKALPHFVMESTEAGLEGDFANKFCVGARIRS